MYFKSVLVTGANRGIGLEFVKQFLSLPQPPRWVFATCRNLEKAKDLKALAEKFPNNLKIKLLEVTEHDSIKALAASVAEDLGDEGLTLLINNAGCLKKLALSDANETDMIEAFRIMALGPLFVSQAFLPLLRKSALEFSDGDTSNYRAGIINISARTASITENTSGGFYYSRPAKVALNMISKSLSIDLKVDGILVAILNPGWVMTELGGAGAKTEVWESVSKLMTVIQSLTMEDTGTFINHDGKKLPW